MGAVLVTVVAVALTPAAAMAAARRWRVIDWLSPTIVCYFAGMILANAARSFVHAGIASTITEAAVALAVPMLLFSTDLPRWWRMAGKTVLSFTLACASVMAAAAVAAKLFADRIPDVWKVAGMLVGVYTGGTPNMSAIGLALQVPEETFVLVNGADVIVCAFYLLFLMSVAQRTLHLFLPRFESRGDAEPVSDAEPAAIRARDRAAALALATLAAGASAGLSVLVLGEVSVAFFILTLTTLSVGASLVPRIRSLPGSYETGQYVLLMFCVAIGTLADFRRIVGTGIDYVACVGFVVAAAVALHYAVAALFRIDADTVLITSTAAVFGPAFVGPIAGVLKNREVVMSGITTGLVGYAVGNYLGLGLAYWLAP